MNTPYRTELMNPPQRSSCPTYFNKARHPQFDTGHLGGENIKSTCEIYLTLIKSKAKKNPV